MSLFLILIGAFTLIHLKPQIKNEKNSFLDKDVTLSVCGIFVLIIFLSHFLSYIDSATLNVIDKPAKSFVTALGQLMVTPFLFYSGFGVFESFKKKRFNYVNGFLKNRVLKLYISFLIALILYICLSFLLKSNYNLTDYLLSFIGLGSIGNSNWYVVVIIGLYLTSFVSFKFFGYDKLTVVACTQIILSFFLYFILRNGNLPSYWYNTIIAYSFGTAVSLFKEKISKLVNKTKILPYILFIFSGMLFFVFYYLLPTYIVYSDFVYSLSIVFFLLSIIFFTSICQIKNSILLFLGKHAFWIYILQRLPMIGFSSINFIHSNRYVYFVACLFFTIGLAFIFRRLFEKSWNLFVKNGSQTSESNNVSLGIVISYISLGVSIIGSIFITPKILNALGDEQYGLYSFATSITAWLTVISTALSASYIRFATKDQKEKGTTARINTIYFKLFLIIAIFILVLLFAAIAIVYFSGFKLPQYTVQENNLVLLLMLISGISVFSNLVFCVFAHFNNFKKQFIFTRSLTLVFSILTYGFEVVFAVLTKSVISVAIVSTCLSILSFIITVIYSRKTQKIPFDNSKIKDNSKLIKSILVFSSFVIFNTIVDRINKDVDKTILGIMVNAQSVTTYTLSKTFNTYLMTLSVSISSTFVPKIHELVVSNKKDDLGELFLKVSSSQLLVLCFVIGGFISCGRPFVSMWLGESRIAVFYHAIPFLLLDIVALSCNLCIEIQRAMNKHKFRAVLYILLASINVGISVLMVYILPAQYAIWGVTIGTVFSVILGNWVILNIYNKKVIGLPIGKYFLIVLKYILYTGAAVGVAYLINYFLSGRINSNLFKFIVLGF